MQKVTSIKSTLRLYDNTHGRYWDFEEFKILGGDFILAFANCFVLHVTPIARSSAQTSYNEARRFLRFIVKKRKALPRLIAALKNDYTKATVQDWEKALALWRDDLISKTEVGPVTKHNQINTLNILLRRMVTYGVIPAIEYLNSNPKALKSAKTIPFLAELHPVGGDEPSGGSAEEQAEAMFELNLERLEMVRSCAAQDFQRWRDHMLKGMRMVQDCDLEFEEIAATVDGGHQDMHERARALRALFPDDDEELTLARFLKYFAHHPERRGRLFKASDSSRPPGWYKVLARRLGGQDILQAYLFPPPELTTAVITLFLCDTGANVAVAKTLPLDCMEESTERGYKIIKGTKMRAGGKLIVNELPVKDPAHEVGCVEALDTYRTLSERLRKLAPEEAATRLFLHYHQYHQSGSVTTLTAFIWGSWFQAFRNRYRELKELKVESRMIRPSVLLQASRINEAGITAAGAIGAHASLATTWTYVAKSPNRAFWAGQVRKFQSLFQAVSIQSIEGAAEKLGLSTGQVEKLLGEAYRTGLGVVCIDPRAGVQPGSEKGEDCTQLQNCHSCPNRVVVATEENLKDLILWNRHLELHRPEWEQSRPERWGKVWLPWLVFTQVVIEQASRGRTAKQYKRARACAEALLAAGTVNLPPLW